MKIVIVGGGTIGWLTTFVMSKIRPKHQYINIPVQTFLLLVLVKELLDYSEEY